MNMNTAKKVVLFSALLFGSGLVARASMRAADSLTWISDHLPTVSYTVTTPHATYAEYASAKMEFQGCWVKVVEDVKTEKSEIQTTVSFKLSDLQMDKIRSQREAGSGNTQVTPYYDVLLPLASTVTNFTTFNASDRPITENGASNSVSLTFQDRDLANRQADAWRDAAFACGARASNQAQ
jgi:hypothetical protein